ncbi:MAG: hypothetical protein ACI4JK_02220 [Oscillospiraceae bacterium]
MTPKEKSYIISILAEKRVEQQNCISSLYHLNVSAQARTDAEGIYINHINAIDKAIEFFNK